MMDKSNILFTGQARRAGFTIDQSRSHSYFCPEKFINIAVLLLKSLYYDKEITLSIIYKSSTHIYCFQP